MLNKKSYKLNLFLIHLSFFIAKTQYTIYWSTSSRISDMVCELHSLKAVISLINQTILWGDVKTFVDLKLSFPINWQY